MAPYWNETLPGFEGNDNIYGIGIRVGYYTQAISLWVANFYARHEAPYLHTLTILFLVALFVGICQLCRDPSQTRAVEPFMLTSIAYHTLYLGLWDWSPPYLLRWEVEFRKRFVVLIVWIAFHSFDTWYWWWGVWRMMPSDGPMGTIIFYPYVGNTPLLGPDQWISNAAKVLNVLILTILSVGLVRHCCNTIQQRRMDRLITADRFKTLTSRWLQVLNRPSAENPLGTGDESSRRAHAKDFDTVSSTATAKSDDIGPAESTSDVSKEAHSSCNSERNSDTDLPPYRRPTRTGTGLLKLGLWRTFSNKDQQIDLSIPPPDYVLYEPTFEALNSAYDLLKASTTCPEGKSQNLGFQLVQIWLYGPIWFATAVRYLATQIRFPCHPSTLLAITSHANSLQFACLMSYPTVMRRAIRHPVYPCARPRDLVLASRIILSTEELVSPSRVWWLIMGYVMLGACSVLVIGTELTIQWNKIQGVQDVGSVGQLIPLTLGAGSLLKIVWSAIFEGSRGNEFCTFRHCVTEKKGAEWREAGKTFLECREAVQSRKQLHGSGKDKAGDEKC